MSSARRTAFLQHGPLHRPSNRSLTPRTALSPRRSPAFTRTRPLRHARRGMPCLTAAPDAPGGQAAANTTTKRDDAAPAPSVVERPAEFWTEQWYPVAFTHDVPVGKLHSFHLFDRPYVLFKDEATGLYVVMDDVCPHRAVPLSEGRLLSVENRTVLECAYHGWQFDCSGACTLIPGGGPEFRIPAAANIYGLYATAVTKADLIFFFPGDRLRADAVPIVQPDILANDPRTIVFRTFWRLIPLPFEVLVENLVDPAHVAFAHHGTGEGDREQFMQRDPGSGQRVTGRDDASGELETTAAAGVSVLRGGGTSNIVSVVTALFDLHLVLHVAPARRGLCNLFAYRVVLLKPGALRSFRVLKFRVKIAVPRPRWVDHCRGHVILDGDTAYLRNTEGMLRASGRSWRDAYTLANGTWDVTVAAFRKWFDRYGDTMPFLVDADPLAEPLTDAQVNDRERWHGKDCVSCTAALRNFHRGRVGAAAVAVVGIAVAVTAWMVATALAAQGQTAAARRVGWGAVMAASIAALAVAVAVGCGRGVTALTYTDMAKRMLNA